MHKANSVRDKFVFFEREINVLGYKLILFFHYERGIIVSMQIVYHRLLLINGILSALEIMSNLLNITKHINKTKKDFFFQGIFRMACENVLKTMRKGRETLLTLLEAFVYDPLIDWTVGGEVLAGTSFGGISSVSSKQSKKDLEKEVTLSMFNVRCTEMRVEWNENK